MLMCFGTDGHFWNAVPRVEHLVIIPEADLPLVGARAERERRKRVREDVNAGFECEICAARAHINCRSALNSATPCSPPLMGSANSITKFTVTGSSVERRCGWLAGAPAISQRRN